MAKDFSDQKHLGFLRFLQFCFAFNVIVSISAFAFVIKGSYTFDFSGIIGIINLFFDSISFWLIWHRKRVTRHFVMAFSLFNIIVGFVYALVVSDFTVVDRLVSSSLDIILFIYFATSRRVKQALTAPFSSEVKNIAVEKDIEIYQPKTWAFWRNLMIYFCVFSVVGHWMEAGYCTLIRFGILPGIYDPNSQIWHDWLYPFLVYGFGMVACVLLFFPVKNFLQKHLSGLLKPLLLSFVINAFVCTMIELCMGLMLNQPLPDGSLPLWDYRNMFCNFMGQICLQNAIGFGLISTLITWVVYPVLERQLGRLGKDTMNIIWVVILCGFGLLFFFYCINVVIPDATIQTDETALEQAADNG